MIFLVLLLSALFAGRAGAAWDITAAAQFVTLADNAALTIPDGDFSICGWFKKDTNAGTGFGVIQGWDTINANPSANIYCREASNATAPNSISVLFEDATANEQVAFNSSGTPCATTTWQQLCFIRSGASVFTLYLANSSIGTETDTAVDAIDVAGSWRMGVEGDGAGSDYMDGALAEWAKWDRALTADERATLQKYTPRCVPGFAWYTPSVREYIEIKAGIAVTNTSTVALAHPPLIDCY